MQNRFSCYVIGDGSLTIQCCNVLHKRGHQLLGVVSSSPDLAKWCREHGVRIFKPTDDYLSLVSSHVPDYLFSVVNMRLLPAELVGQATRGAINFHDGPLPRYAGVHATSWALINREQTHGVTWHFIGDLIDGGAVLEQEEIEISHGTTAFDLNTQCFQAGIATFSRLLKKLEAGNLQPLAQDISQRSYYGMWVRPPAACFVSWEKPAAEVSALVRGLDFGPVPNPLGIAKIWTGEEYFLCREVGVVPPCSQAAPGTVVHLASDSLRIATSTEWIEITRLFRSDGSQVSLGDLIAAGGLTVGTRLPTLDAEHSDRLTSYVRRICRHEAAWVERLRHLSLVEIPYSGTSPERSPGRRYLDRQLSEEARAFVSEFRPCDALSEQAELSTPRQHESQNGDTDCHPQPAEVLVVAFATFVARLSGQTEFDLGWLADRHVPTLPAGLFSAVVPFRVVIDLKKSFQSQCMQALRSLRRVQEQRTFLHDVVARYPDLNHRIGTRLSHALAVQIEVVEQLTDEVSVEECELRFVVDKSGDGWRIAYDQALLGAEDVHRMAEQFSTWLNGLVSRVNDPLASLPILSESEWNEIVESWNATEVEFPRELTVHAAFEAQAAATPQAIALVCGNEEVTYQALNERSNRLGHYLQAQGVGPDTLVGICLDRSVEMVVGLLAILKSGGAYVPLDPSFPADRISLMLEDSQAPLVLTQERLVSLLPIGTRTICIDSDDLEIRAEDDGHVLSQTRSQHLAYVIYTSGSTGQPKGVMVEHRNVVNFFVGMDQKIEIGAQPVWLAVTSLSFDISVLEILWTLSRGFKVVVFTAREFDRSYSSAATLASRDKSIDYSIFYFSADQGEDPQNKYRLLREGAKFADEHGFSAVWTPERHFHEFGGLYPNPSVVGAALAEITNRVQIRSGSVVTPLHSPVRIAEEWSVVDNLSRGRVGISFASGWMPEDFVIKPESFANPKEIMFETMEKVRRLWRGETVSFPHPVSNRDEVLVRTLPRPLQEELPVWITTAGNPQTYEMAAQVGANVLTHLLGQSIEEVAKKIARYRELWKEYGHPGRGYVSLMLHTFVSENADTVKETVRQPLTEYLRTSTALIKKYSWAFPTFRRQGLSAEEVSFEGLSDEEMDAVLAHAFERYYETSGLFGTPDSCQDLIDKLKVHDVDEVACLIDFGVQSDLVLKNLTHLNTLRAATSQPAAAAIGHPGAGPAVLEDQSIPALIRKHDVTHFQCTPSMAMMLLVDESTKASLGRLRTWMIGGEPFPESLAARINEFMDGHVINMYGPTEATVWSTTYVLNGNGAISIGRPIANTQVYVVDDNLQPVPVGVTGELVIGGEGVVRGYHRRPELTSERFVQNPFRHQPGARIYKTGDFVRFQPDGNIHFVGRIDQQVKIRGYRIELAEIETILSRHPCVKECVVVAREDHPGDKRLVAYVIVEGSDMPPAAELQEYVGMQLPAYMVPSHIVFLDAFPLTPNKKIDRKLLPPPGDVRVDACRVTDPPQTEIEEVLAELWKDALAVQQVGRNDDFFELGGHSLSAVQIAFNIGKAFQISFPLRIFMEDPVLSVLAQRVEDLVLESADAAELEELLSQIENNPDVQQESPAAK